MTTIYKYKQPASGIFYKKCILDYHCPHNVVVYTRAMCLTKPKCDAKVNFDLEAEFKYAYWKSFFLCVKYCLHILSCDVVCLDYANHSEPV